MIKKTLLPLLFGFAFLGCSHPSVKNTPQVPPPTPAEPAKLATKHVSGTGWELDIPENFNVLLKKNPGSGRELASASPDLDRLVYAYLDDLDEGGLSAYVGRSLNDIRESEQLLLEAKKIQWHNKETAHLVWFNPTDAALSEGWLTINNNKIFLLMCVLMDPKEKTDFCSNVALTIKFN